MRTRNLLAFAGTLALLGATPANVPATIVPPATGGVPWTPEGIARLDADLDALVAASPALRGAHYGVLAIDTASGTPLFARGIDDEIQPASTLKLVVGSAALDRLGPTFRFHTTLGLAEDPAAAPPALVLHASGDPTLAASDLRDGVASFVRGGTAPAVRNVFVDDSAFDATPYAPGWTWDDFGEAYAPMISAATLDENVVAIEVAPGPAPGAAAVARDVDWAGHASISAACPPSPPAAAGAAASVPSHVITGRAGSEDTVDVRSDPRGCRELVGAIPADAQPERVAVAVVDPLAFAQGVLHLAVAARDGATSYVFGDAPGEAMRPPPVLPGERIVWTHDSQPLGTLLGPRFWIPSDNLFGENLLKTLGLVTAGKPGTAENGIAYERAWLQSLGLDPASVTLADGCGMSQYDRITARDLVTILQHDWNGPNRQLVLDSLPVGGARGTIEGIAGTPAAGRVFAKTGSMRHVRGLAGYLATERHGAATFAFEIDEWNGDYAALATLRANVLARIVRD